MSKIVDITGQKFCRLSVIKPSHQDKRKTWHWLCKCDCGEEIVASGLNIRRGHTKSCGCLNKETGRQQLLNHGMTGTRFHTIWMGIIKRCNLKSNGSYKDYGGRGIKVCKKWHDFFNFKDDMYEEYLRHSDKFEENNTSIDRIDNNKGYYKENCKWATRIEQARNTRTNRYITYKGITKCVAGWEDEFNLKRGVLYRKLNSEKDEVSVLNNLSNAKN